MTLLENGSSNKIATSVSRWRGMRRLMGDGISHPKVQQGQVSDAAQAPREFAGVRPLIDLTPSELEKDLPGSASSFTIQVEFLCLNPSPRPIPMSQPDSSTDTTFRSLLITDPPVLSPDMTVAQAVGLLLQHRLLSMPVVDTNRHFLGQFSKKHLISCLLPILATHTDPQHQVERMIEAGLLQDTLEEVQERYHAIAGKPVSEHLDKTTTVLRPDQPLVNALFFLFSGHNLLPVVEPNSHVLAGVVSTWDVLARITSQP
jgi:CBS domain-containing protein